MIIIPIIGIIFMVMALLLIIFWLYKGIKSDLYLIKTLKGK